MTGGALPVLLYLGLAVLIGLLGKKAKFGFWVNFLVSVILSPLVGLIVLLAQERSPDYRHSAVEEPVSESEE